MDLFFNFKLITQGQRLKKVEKYNTTALET